MLSSELTKSKYDEKNKLVKLVLQGNSLNHGQEPEITSHQRNNTMHGTNKPEANKLQDKTTLHQMQKPQKKPQKRGVQQQSEQSKLNLPFTKKSKTESHGTVEKADTNRKSTISTSARSGVKAVEHLSQISSEYVA